MNNRLIQNQIRQFCDLNIIDGGFRFSIFPIKNRKMLQLIDTMFKNA
jgi:hypothetical protein